jgi:hypothetical protein
MKIPNQDYTPEFRELVVKRVKEGQSAVAVDLMDSTSVRPN